MSYGGEEEGNGETAEEMDYVANTGENGEGEEEEEEEEEESRDLTHEEIWDDSALIDAWNSAAAEYEVRRRIRFLAYVTHSWIIVKAYHGKDNKEWKNEPVKRSPL